MSKFKPTGLQNIDISTGDSPERIEDNFDPMDYLTEIIYSKDVGSFKQEVAYVDDMELGRVTEPSEVSISVERIKITTSKSACICYTIRCNVVV